MSGLASSLRDVTFLHPEFAFLLLLIPCALWVARRGGRASILFAPYPLVDGDGGAPALPRTWRTRLAAMPRVLQVAGLVLVVVALARPVRRDPLPPTSEGIDLLLCVDVSSSMRANDLDPSRSRLDVAKGAAARFVEGRPGDRIGLVTFARFPDLRCPPTLDHAALLRIIGAAAPVESDGPLDATGIGTAVARAAQVLRAGGATSKVVVLLTDGEENVATADAPDEIAPLHAGQLCRELGVRVYAIAAGLGERRRDGTWVALDTRPVRALAERTGGRFFEARDAGAVASVYAEIDRLERVARDEPRHRIVDTFLPVLGTALVLLVGGRLLGATVLAVLP